MSIRSDANHTRVFPNFPRFVAGSACPPQNRPGSPQVCPLVHRVVHRILWMDRRRGWVLAYRGGMRRRAVTTAIPLALGGLVLGGCSTSTDTTPPPATGRTTTRAPATTRPATPTGSAIPTQSPTPTPTPTEPPLPKVGSELSLPALMRKRYPGSRIRRVRLQRDLGRYQRWEVSYRSGDLTNTGILLVPDGKGPFPAIVLNHGHIERSRYRSGQGVPREQDHLARQGFVVLHTDYRGHAGSDDTSELDHTLRLGYAEDAPTPPPRSSASRRSIPTGSPCWAGRRAAR